MPFDITTAKPATSGFDINSARSVDEQKPVENIQPEQPVAPAPQGNLIHAALEPLKAIGGAIGGSIAGGYAGLYDLAIGGDIDSAVKVLSDVQNKFASAPQTQEGQNALALIQKSIDTLGSAVNAGVGGTAGLMNVATNPVSNITGGFQQARDVSQQISEQGIGKTLGEGVFEKTGNPLAATVAEVSPDVAGTLLGALKVGARTPVKSKLLKKIEENPNNPEFAKYMVKSGDVVKDRLAIAAKKQGFDTGVIQVIKNAMPKDRAKMLRMVNKYKNSKLDALYAAKNRPADVAGESLLERVNFVKKINRESGKELEGVAKRLKGNVDFSAAVNEFTSALDDIGVRLDKNLKPIFKGSDIEGAKGAESVIKKIVARMKNQDDVDAYGVHRLKKFIDEQVTYGKVKKGLAGKSERILKDLRRNLDSALDSQFPEYNRVNTTYSDTISAIDELKAAAGKKLNLFGDNSDKATGTLLRRLMSNAQGRVTLMDAIDSVESVAKKYGDDLTDDITTQVLFADELDRMFGAPAKTSLQGELKKGTAEVAQAARGQDGLYSAATNKVGDVLEYARGINEKAAIKSLEELLKEGRN